MASTTQANANPPQVELPPTLRARILMGFVCLLTFFVVYVISAGPMIWIHDHVKVQAFQRTLEGLYAPLAFIVKRDLWPLAPVLKWYVSLFR